MTIITAVFVSLVSAAALATRERIEQNEQTATQREIVKITGLWDSRRYDSVRDVPADEIIAIYSERIQGPIEKQGLTLFYAANEMNDIVSIVFPISGMGFWGPIHGYVAVHPDTKKIQGITFDRQEETPGLGGEIVKPWFQEQFAGKTIHPPEEGKPVIELVKNATSKSPNQVDAITGASRTSYAVQNILDNGIRLFFESGGFVPPEGR